MTSPTRQFHARMQAAAKAFKMAGGRDPYVRVSGDVIEVFEKPANLSDGEDGARAQAKIDLALGAPRS